MKLATLEDFKELSKNGGCRILFHSEMDYPELPYMKRSERRINEFIEGLASRVKTGPLFDALTTIQKPLGIWVYAYDAKEKGLFGQEYNKTFYAHYLVFQKQLTEQEVFAWNMWIMGFWTRSN